MNVCRHELGGSTPHPTLGVIGDIAESDFEYWYRCYHSVVCLFARLSIMFVYCAQMAAPCLSQIALKFALHRSTLSSPNFDTKVTHPVDLSIGESDTFDGNLRPNGSR